MTFKEQLSSSVTEVEQVLHRYLPKEEGFQKTIFEAMNYSMNAGGKRIRPLLMREVYRLFGGKEEAVEPFMAAIEMIHTSSLVHDDLPCMDNDELRRGFPTTWVKYGYDMAVLAGDGLLIYAIETATKAFALSSHPERIGESIQVLAKKTGIYGMIGGQTVDVELTGHAVSKESLEFIYHLKTGALLQASMVIGAILAGASATEIKKVESIASCIGMAFQIQDDILDRIGNAQLIGKPILSDEKNNKTTYVTLYGLDVAKKEVERLSNQALDDLESIPFEHSFLEALIRMLVHREK